MIHHATKQVSTAPECDLHYTIRRLPLVIWGTHVTAHLFEIHLVKPPPHSFCYDIKASSYDIKARALAFFTHHAWPALWFNMDFVAHFLLFINTSNFCIVESTTSSWPWNILQAWNFTSWLIAKVASSHSATLGIHWAFQNILFFFHKKCRLHG